MRIHPTISGAVKAVALNPPWYVRVVGAVIVVGDAALWVTEHTPVSMLELIKHGILLAIGLAMFYPEGLVLVINSARRLPFFDRRKAGPRVPK